MAAWTVLALAAAASAAPLLARTRGVPPHERAALASALSEVTGAPWVALDATPAADAPFPAPRLAAVHGCTPLDAQYAAEVLDELVDAPILLVAVPPTPADAADAEPITDAEALALVRRHESAWGLRLPMPLPAAPSGWEPSAASLTAHVQMDGAWVQHSPHAPPRWDVSSVVVLDDVLDRPLRAALRSLLGERLAGGGAAGPEGAGEEEARDGGGGESPRERPRRGGAAGSERGAEGAGEAEAKNSRGGEGARENEGGAVPPIVPLDEALWTRALVDRDDAGEGAAPTWSLRARALARLCAPRPPPPAQAAAGGADADAKALSAAPAAHGRSQPAAMLELQARLCQLLPHADVTYAPPPFAAPPACADAGDGGDGRGRGGGGCDGDGGGVEDEADGGDDVELDGTSGGSTPVVANAPMHGDAFDFHIDGDPFVAQASPWTDLHGNFPNRAPCPKPRLVSALVYLSEGWDSERWGAWTLFRDPPSGALVRVGARPGRVVLLDQDLEHSVSAPSARAGAGRARLSLALKLCLHAKGVPTPPPVVGAEGGGAAYEEPPRAAAPAARAADGAIPGPADGAIPIVPPPGLVRTTAAPRGGAMRPGRAAGAGGADEVGAAAAADVVIAVGSADPRFAGEAEGAAHRDAHGGGAALSIP